MAILRKPILKILAVTLIYKGFRICQNNGCPGSTVHKKTTPASELFRRELFSA